MKKYTIDEIRKYLEKQDSFGDALYNLNESNIDKAQSGLQILKLYTDELFLSLDNSITEDDEIHREILIHMENEAMEIGNSDIQPLDELLESLDCYISDVLIN